MKTIIENMELNDAKAMHKMMSGIGSIFPRVVLDGGRTLENVCIGNLVGSFIPVMTKKDGVDRDGKKIKEITIHFVRPSSLRSIQTAIDIEQAKEPS